MSRPSGRVKPSRTSTRAYESGDVAGMRRFESVDPGAIDGGSGNEFARL